ncbi:sec-independent protein translocase protein TATA, chloroplastic-like [Chenopodium quinoa]|uniref:sec-independent protein translocase protein TATA, chloroplastic-like n=1 Tax=Chenopodium quinoa TaxID=63459 RepID=UPI000B79487B|nr:sec-independent protein translocase protein TATA, chloroplastic-like [Chenopodium quinoa]
MEILTVSPSLSLSSPQKPAILSSSKSSLFLNQSSTTAFFRINTTGLGLRVRTRPATRTRKGFCCNSLFGLGVPELAVIAGVAAIVFGPKQLPEIGRSFGKTIKSFQQAAKEFEQELKNPEDAESSDNVIEAKSASESSEGKENVVSSSKESS